MLFPMQRMVKQTIAAEAEPKDQSKTVVGLPWNMKNVFNYLVNVLGGLYTNTNRKRVLSHFLSWDAIFKYKHNANKKQPFSRNIHIQSCERMCLCAVDSRSSQIEWNEFSVDPVECVIQFSCVK